MTTNRVFLLRKRPDPEISDETLELVEREVPEPGEGEVLVRNQWLSLDPTNRGWMNAQATYLPAIPLGDPMRGITVGRVEKSNFEGVPEGMIVGGMGGFADYAVLPGESLNPVPPGIDPKAALSVLGHIGLAAYWGLFDIGKPVEGDTVLVSGAAGATGSLVVQMAKLKGCRVVGTAGSDDKCSVAHRRRSALDGGDQLQAPPATSPRRCFDGVSARRRMSSSTTSAATILDAGLANAQPSAGGSFVCGGISQYNAAKVQRPEQLPQPHPCSGARMEGFVVLDYLSRTGEAFAEIVPWLQGGKLQMRYHVVDGLENAADALQLLFTGGNQGKLLVRIAE